MRLLKEIITRTIDKFRYAFEGLWAGLRYDLSITVQFICALIAIVVFMILKISTIEWLFVASAIFIVLIAEYFNSAIEDVCDLLVDKYDLHVKEIKDIAAAGVLLAAFYAVTVAGVIILGRVL